ncbi:reverse transcriptase domain-containing protein [Tanacetum coccineum]
MEATITMEELTPCPNGRVWRSYRTLPSNTIPNPKGEIKVITTRSGVAYEGPSIPTNPSPKKVVERETEETTDKEQSNFQGSTAYIPPPVNLIPILEPDVPKTLPKPNIPYPSRLDNQKLREIASYQKEKIFQKFQELRFDISFADALLLMPRFAPTIRNLLMNKEKLLELAKIPLNENCLTMLLKKLPEKLGDPSKGDICLIEKLLNNDPFQLSPMDLKQGEVTEAKSSIEEPLKLELKDLPSNLEYAYLEENDKLPVIIAKGFKDDEKEALLKVLKSHKRAITWKITDIKGYFQILIDPQDQEKTTFTCPYGTFAYRRMPFGLCNAPGTFQRCMMAIFHDMIEKTMEVFMDDFSVFGDSFDSCLSNLEKMLKRPMTHLLEKETPFVFSKDCIDAFETLKKKLTEAPS